ncbi:MAG TPA: Asp-tRNA(Asn)/Glu-tRNA(Gln) amidotransferase subunit GatC [Polyangiaceae bacterium]|nr:Asp-tRNA(Asn)/Glu-tRNA(Gln) amidotransferase subunit GatC [Polyangiaceae bacterium]
MAITEAEVLHVARLARLSLSEDETRRATHDLARVLEYVRKLDELDTSNLEPTLTVGVDAAPLRDDRVLPGVDKAEVLAQAPRSSELGFMVPGFVDES